MDRQAMLETIEKAYEARVRGDVDGVMRGFADNARFQINAAPSDARLAHVVEGQDALRNVMSQLIDGFTFADMEVLDSVVEGDKAAVRRRFTVRANSTGKTAKTEVFDLFEFEKGKIAALTQFCDTAVAAQLSAK